jgi:uncharacterized protein (UPF0276 family)
MENFENAFHNLKQFLGGYFHQFWKEALEWQGKHPNFEDVVEFYKSNDSFENVSETAEELRKFIALNLSEENMRKLFVRHGIWYGPQYQNMTYRQWLEAILTILEQKKVSSSFLRFKNAVGE